jgi:predicted small metal-binding protein
MDTSTERIGNGGDEEVLAMRALLCGCQQRLAASDKEGLFGRVLEHLEEHHPMVTLSEARVRELVADRSYEFEEVTVVGADAEEEFGIDPY